MKNLKGFIEVSQIVELDDMDESVDDHGNIFRIATSTGREYFIAAPDHPTKLVWLKAIKKTIRRMASGHVCKTPYLHRL